MPRIPDVPGPAEVAALEQLPADSRGFRRTLRLHAVAVEADAPSAVSVCGYRYEPDELRARRRWDSVTPSGRCALCEVQVRRRRRAEAASDSSTGDAAAIDLTDVDLDEATDPPRLSLVQEPTGSERRARDRS